MAHFAELDSNNVVLRVLVVSNDNAPDPAPNNEQQGIDFLESLGLGNNWKQTSFNSNFRAHYAGPGFSYDPVNDVFVAPQPYPSWTLDENFDWQPPVARPIGNYVWDEATLAWVELN